MRSIGFSTGALALSDFRLALKELEGQPVDSIELSALRYRELEPLMNSLETLPLERYRYKSIHAPSSFDAGQEAEIIGLLRNHVPRSWPIILHPDTVHDLSASRNFGAQLAIENMDRRKPIGRTCEELAVIFKELPVIFKELPHAMFCFDIGHARQCDTTMTEAYRILRAYAGRLCQVHVSEVNTASRHDPLSFAAIRAFTEVAQLVPEHIPLILESRVSEDQIATEIEKAHRAFPIPALQSVSA